MRKSHIRAIALWAAVLSSSLLGTATLAQSPPFFPPKIGPNTVVGRLGSGTTGPAQAVPFASLGNPVTYIDYVRSFGAKCDGVTDDTLAIQAAINDGVANNWPVRINGSCVISGALTIASSVDFGGYNVQNDRLLTNASGFNAININGVGPVNIHDMAIGGSGTNEGIDITATGSANSNSRFNNLDITNFLTGIHFVAATGWQINQTRIEAMPANGVGIIIENTNCVDCGDNGIFGSDIQCGNGAQAAVYWKSGGGFSFVGNKVLGGSCATSLTFNLASGAETSDIFISSNSLEANSTVAAILFERQGATGDFFSIEIANNEMIGASGASGVSVPTDANGAWLHSFSVVGNSMGVSGANVISIDSATNIAIAYNQLATNSTNKGTVIGSHVTGGIVGPNICTNSSPTFTACTTSTNGGTNVTTFVPF